MFVGLASLSDVVTFVDELHSSIFRSRRLMFTASSTARLWIRYGANPNGVDVLCHLAQAAVLLELSRWGPLYLRLLCICVPQAESRRILTSPANSEEV